MKKSIWMFQNYHHCYYYYNSVNYKGITMWEGSTAKYLKGTENISYSFDNDSKQGRVVSFELFKYKNHCFN